jgi:predicted RNase H-like HicB family nuclease
MSRPRRPVLFLFVDGVGLAPQGAANPFATLPLQALDRLVGGLWSRDRSGGRADLVALDATLGVQGLPQSATGQTTLFTGVNAAAHVGHHVPALPGARLKRLLADRSVFRRLASSGSSVTFANVFTRGYLDGIEAGTVRPSATTLAVRAADVPFRLPEEYAAGRAVAWDVTGERSGPRAGVELPVVSAPQAGRILAGIAAEHDCTLYETFLPDLAGHGRWGITVEEALRALDGLLEGVLEAASDDLTILLTSDHGNVEEPAHRRHTRNPVPLVVWGPGRGAFAGATSIADVAGQLESWIDGAGGT